MFHTNLNQLAAYNPNLGTIGPIITLFIGVLVFVGIPMVGSGTKWNYQILQTYLGVAFSKLNYAILIEHPNDTLTLNSPDTQYGLYKVELDDDVKFWDDNAGHSKKFYGGTLGYTRTDIPCITTPRVCEAAEELHHKHEQDDIETIESEKERAEVMKRDMVVTKDRNVEVDTTITVDKSLGLVSADPVGPVLNNNMRPGDIPIIDSFVKESQSLLGQVGMWEKANAIISFIVGFGVVVLGYDVIAGGSGGGGANLPGLPALIGVVPF